MNKELRKIYRFQKEDLAIDCNMWEAEFKKLPPSGRHRGIYTISCAILYLFSGIRKVAKERGEDFVGLKLSDIQTSFIAASVSNHTVKDRLRILVDKRLVTKRLLDFGNREYFVYDLSDFTFKCISGCCIIQDEDEICIFSCPKYPLCTLKKSDCRLDSIMHELTSFLEASVEKVSNELLKGTIIEKEIVITDTTDDQIEMIELKKKFYTNKYIASIYEISEEKARVMLVKKMEDYDAYTGGREGNKFIAKLVELKRNFVPSKDIAERMDLNKNKLREILKTEMEDYEYYKKAAQWGEKRKKRDLMMRRNKEIRDKLKLDGNLDAKHTCIEHSCKPTQELLERFLHVDQIRSDQECIRKSIIEIENRLLKIRESRQSAIILTAAVWRCTDFSRQESGWIIGVTETPVRKLLQLVELNNKIVKKS